MGLKDIKVTFYLFLFSLTYQVVSFKVQQSHFWEFNCSLLQAYSVFEMLLHPQEFAEVCNWELIIIVIMCLQGKTTHKQQ